MLQLIYKTFAKSLLLNVNLRKNYHASQIDDTDSCCAWRECILNEKPYNDSMTRIIKKLPDSEEKIWFKAKEIPCFEYPIFKAIKASHPDCCFKLVHAFPVMMYACNDSGTPPLVYAIPKSSENQMKIIELLLSNSKCVGFMLNQKNGNYENALYQAVE